VVEGHGYGLSGTATHIYVPHYTQDKLVKVARDFSDCGFPTDIPITSDKASTIIKIGNILYVLNQGSLTYDPSISEVDTANGDAVTSHTFGAVYTDDVKDMVYESSIDSFLVTYESGIWAVNRSTWNKTAWGDITTPMGGIDYLDGYVSIASWGDMTGHIVDPATPNNDVPVNLTVALDTAMGYSSSGLTAFFMQGNGLRAFDLTGTELAISPIFTGYYGPLTYVVPWVTGPVCQNGTKETGEDCDQSDLGGATCQSEGFDDGTLACTGSCTFDTSGCYDYVCGNGNIEGTEECDGTDFGGATCQSEGFEGGSLSCSGTCTIDTSNCHMCGNGSVDTGEDCDGANLDGETCTSQGFDGGTLACSTGCSFDTSSCTTNTCGNGSLDTGEDCDGANLDGETCTSQGFAGGTLACQAGSCAFDTSGCTMCGNGNIDGSEECDGSNLSGHSCSSLGFTGGTLSCSSGCTFNTSSCEMSTCGDGVLDTGEQCDDGNETSGDGCSDQCQVEPGYECDSSEPSICAPLCGNGEIDAGEECDGDNLNGETCTSLGNDDGTLSCTANCTFDTSQCGSCNQDNLVTVVGDELDRDKLSDHNLDLYVTHLDTLTKGSSFGCETLEIDGQQVEAIAINLEPASYENLSIDISGNMAMCHVFAEEAGAVVFVNADDPKKTWVEGGSGSGISCTEDGANIQTQFRGLILAALGTGFSYRKVSLNPRTNTSGDWLEVYVSDASISIFEASNDANSVVVGLPEMWDGPIYVNLDAVGDLSEILNREPNPPGDGCSGCSQSNGATSFGVMLFGILMFLLLGLRRSRRRAPSYIKENNRNSR